MSTSSEHFKRTLSTSSQKSEDNDIVKRRRLTESEGTQGSRPARTDSRWQPVAERTEASTKTQEKRSLKETAELVDQKTKELSDWIAGRLQDHAWNTSNRELFKAKLSTYQSVQINGHEKNLADVLVKDVGAAARQKLPDEIKKDLVNSVQAFLTNNDDVLRYFRQLGGKAP